ncbi:pilus assembly protein TadG-related protein [Ornithinimicrobium murale]|uniref:pilus assembly protein TadG-related protein n=1 Tax=Ornithinimicrobium murale TaxID=1050153 RepID=UPI0013B40F35|nr:pilus assembly protein TadG-related protein [Ornithinimicrobium murale]
MPEPTADRGAVAIVFALSLLVLIGFVGLGIDVTSAYAKSQEAQNAADAGALAVAQECADADPACASGSHGSLVDDLAEGNIRSGYDPELAPEVNISGNRVTVEVTAENQNMFVGLFGFDTFTVVREATAQWEHPAAGPAMLPLTISACQFYSQAGDPVLNQEINVWLPKGSYLEDPGVGCGTLDYPPGGFGWLDHTDCVVTVETDDWAPGDTGADRPDECMLEALNVGEVLLIPIFSDITGSGNNAQFQIDRFAAMKLLGWHFTEGGPTIREGLRCPASSRPSTSDYRNSCLNVEFVEWVEVGEGYTGGAEDTEVSIIRLIDPAYEDSQS